ncbi:MAG: HNH endonuclease [Cypionkella sp.]
MKGQWTRYIPEELVWIEAHKGWPRRMLHQGFCALFGRTDVTQDALHGLCLRKGWLTGRTGQIAPGALPLNKGKKMPWHPNCAATQFKAGQTPANVKGLGHERLSKDGYVEISVAEKNPWTGHSRRYVQKHRWLWKQANGPVPEGMRLKCLDGDRANTDPSNWRAIPAAMAPRLNGIHGRGYDTAPAELKPTIMAITELEHAARIIRKGGQI